jgi:hypothetical protein
MTEPTPIRTHTSRTRTVKAAIVGRAEVIGVRPAAREAGIPVSTLESWRTRSEFARLRTEKREDVAADVWAAFQKGVRRIEELFPTTEDIGKVAVASGILYDKFALMSGMATTRTETKALTEGMDDHERARLREVLDEVLSMTPEQIEGRIG